MANEVFKTPDVYLKEVDNTFVRDSSNTVFGTGAITLKANQGPVNQRLLFTRFRDFQQVFGKPTSTTDYGHFAARLYMAVAPSLYVVRASYGDEAYATIQYPRDEVPSKYFEFLSAGNPFIKITTTAETSDLINVKKIENVELDEDFIDINGNNYVYTSNAVVPNEGIYYNLKADRYEKSIFCSANINKESQEIGTYLNITAINESKLMLKNSAYTPSATFIMNEAPKSLSTYGETITSNIIQGQGDSLSATFAFDESNQFTGTINDYNTIISTKLSATGSQYVINPEGETNVWDIVKNTLCLPIDIEITTAYTLDSESNNIKTHINYSAINSLPEDFSGNYTEIKNAFTIKEINTLNALTSLSAKSYYTVSSDYDFGSMTKITTFNSWEMPGLNPQIYIKGTPLVPTSAKEVRSINYMDYGMGDDENALVVAYTKAEDVSSCSAKLKSYIYDSYGTNSVEAKDYIPYIGIRVDRFNSDVETERLPEFLSGNDFKQVCESLNKLDETTLGINDVNEPLNYVDIFLTKGEIIDNEKLFIIYQGVSDEQPITTSIHNILKNSKGEYIETPTVPVNCENTKLCDKNDVIKDAMSIPTSQALVMYPDGYTPTCDTDEEPGIGDLESIKTWMDKPALVIGAIGPGKYANDLGIAIVTPDQYDIKALNIPNAFDWRWRFDDEDKNRKTPTTQIKKMISEGGDYDDEANKLIWTQVYKINVYRKPSDKTAEDAWGTGKEAMASNIPVESFLVSNDPKLVDGNGDSLYAPNVINGKSNFIYITRKSVQSMGKKLPYSTYGIFPLVGGKDGTKSGINQKQAALQLYSDPNKANFDLIFNTDAIDTFASREKFKGAQIKFGEIAGSRGEALAIVQATSKEAKKLSKAQAEGKGFSFDYPSYVAMYAGYDKYFDPDLSTSIYLPKSVAAAVTEGWIMYSRNPWDAPAGVENGSIEYTSGPQLLNISPDDLGELYSNNINCSRTMPVYGEVLWGNKTAQKKNTALRSINVRVLMNYVKKNVKQILTPYIFQNNTETTRARMKNQLVNFLGGIEQQGGCTNSRVRVWCSGEDLMNHIVRVELGFIPPYTIEFIPVSVVLDSAANTIDILEA